MAISRRFSWTPGDTSDEMFAIPLPFDPKDVLGKTRAPVVITINGHSYRTTVTTMGGRPWVPLRKSNRDAAGVAAGVSVEVELTLDEAERTVAMPEDLAAALALIPGGRETWDKMSFTHRREHVEAIEAAKKPETRHRRIEKVIETMKSPKPNARGIF